VKNLAKQDRGGVFHRFGKIRLLHQIVAKLGFYALANRLLKIMPVIRRRAVSRMRIRLESVASFVLFEEMFEQASYRRVIDEIKPCTFIDLGCNVGWFPCLIAECGSRTLPIGLMVDADPRSVERTSWLLEENRLAGCKLLWGAVGMKGSKEGVFYMNPSDTQSSLKEFGANHPFPVKGSVKKVQVPILDIGKEWIEVHGSRRVDLLKVDIEGAEGDFLRQEVDFLASLVETIVLEWHKWHITLEDIRGILCPLGFVEISILEEDELGGVVIFSNKRISLP